MMTPADYLTLYESCVVDPRKAVELNYICKVVLSNQNTYKLVELKTGVPWFCVAAIHFRESDQNFTKHLCNGDPLTARTTHVPVGRPKVGAPPFTWQQSAIDVFNMLGIWMPRGWDKASCLEFLERYNGIGYQKFKVNSPYLWDYTDKYTTGLFTADGSFNPNAKESRAGCAAILKTLEAHGNLNLNGASLLLH